MSKVCDVELKSDKDPNDKDHFLDKQLFGLKIMNRHWYILNWKIDHDQEEWFWSQGGRFKKEKILSKEIFHQLYLLERRIHTKPSPTSPILCSSCKFLKFKSARSCFILKNDPIIHTCLYEPIWGPFTLPRWFLLETRRIPRSLRTLKPSSLLKLGARVATDVTTYIKTHTLGTCNPPLIINGRYYWKNIFFSTYLG